ncbi:MAG: glucose-6-phosphate dehydrogenase [Lentisphaerae bacterium]|mgnify:CR=1 FL=1|nr:glucose-6-phosphate dehydrogenase [Lentisphaerota bacterium]MBT4821645.1 glucose-6-phosphate dehydrogenase [Lentisphaerota bacterium]MBT5610998.1 glucose-6-phosphate dehydrogenase [Lentisphaerota bacterium]MBT7061526.1 glucose-6-phosphate dehydrogenase [Lentisphaerota bacterium]MBT7845595.1 glucose-6-phosphate dehydrogenase [Lentisphaerota bacterium]
MATASENLTIVVVGASGDLARKKVIPALFGLYCQGFLPTKFRIFGFARTAMTSEEFRARAVENLTCRYVPGESCAQKMDEFLARCFYVQGPYASRDSFLDLFQAMQAEEGDEPADRLFYLAIPPSVFLDVSRAIGDAGLVQCGDRRPWSRVVVEKPFGRDRASSDALVAQLGHVFTEGQTYRIDHYLGKEVIQNLLVLRFANLIFEPIWNREHVQSVQISWQEDIGTAGRGGYFDSYGIIRDVVQNHLLQIVALTAMEPPQSLNAQHIRDAKVAVLRSVPPVSRDQIVVGQYARTVRDGFDLPGYRDDSGVEDDSITPTFAQVLLHVRNPRWEGIPFLLHAGKAMDEKKTEVRIRFKNVPGNMFCSEGTCPAPNELVICIQPDEGIQLRVANKVPGLGMTLEQQSLDLNYHAAFNRVIPQAYEALLLDALRGDKGLFVRDDELSAAWDIFTPILKELESHRAIPEPYAIGSTGPDAAQRLRRAVQESV